MVSYLLTQCGKIYIALKALGLMKETKIDKELKKYFFWIKMIMITPLLTIHFYSDEPRVEGLVTAILGLLLTGVMLFEKYYLKLK